MTIPAVIAEVSGTILLIAVVILLFVLRKQINARGALEQQVGELSRLADVRQTDLLRVYQEAPVAIVIRKGPELRVEFINEAALQHNRLARETVVGATTTDYFNRVQTNFSEETLREVYRTGEPFKAKAFPLRFDRNGDGKLSEAWYDIVICPTRDPQGDIDGVATYTFDVTEMVQANERLSASDSRFRFIADAIPHKLWTSGPDGKATYYNQGWYDYTGTSALEELRSVIWQLIHPDDLAETTRLWQQAIADGTNIQIEQRLRRHDGAYLWHLSRVCVFKNDAGKVLMWVGTSTNIHEFKTAASALAASEQHFKMLANSNSLLIWQTNDKGETIFVNDTWRAYTGITTAETGLKDWTDNIHPEDREQAMADFKAANQTHAPYRSKYRFRDARRNEYRWMLDTAQPLFNPEFSGYIGAMTDITEQELAQQAIEELARKKDEFFSIASHELKTPITTIKASLQVIQRMLEQPALVAQTLPFITKAGKQAAKLTGIVNDLLDISRIQSGQLDLHPSQFRINELVQDSVEEIATKFPNIPIRFERPEELTVFADPVRIEQVVLNLLDNAVKYGAGQPILVHTDQTEKAIKVSVTDHGIGIPADKQAQIFERFFRVHENSQNYPGLGMGLFICAEIIRRHHGEIGVESEPGKTTFWFTLPDNHAR